MWVLYHISLKISGFICFSYYRVRRVQTFMSDGVIEANLFILKKPNRRIAKRFYSNLKYEIEVDKLGCLLNVKMSIFSQ